MFRRSRGRCRPSTPTKGALTPRAPLGGSVLRSEDTESTTVEEKKTVPTEIVQGSAAAGTAVLHGAEVVGSDGATAVVAGTEAVGNAVRVAGHDVTESAKGAGNIVAPEPEPVRVPPVSTTVAPVDEA